MNTSATELTAPPGRRVWLQTATISAVAITVYLLVRWLPLAGDALHYSDFGAGERGFLEFCEPGSPQFAPVDRVRSPVVLTMAAAAPLRVGETAQITAQLTTASGKPITAEDLLIVHTQKMHLLVIDASREDYHHVHPAPIDSDPGTFAFTFTPQRAGRYRVFADFMPRATGRALYAGASLEVSAGGSGAVAARAPAGGDEVVVNGVRFRLTATPHPLRLNETATIVLQVARAAGGSVALEDVMGAPAHLVAFDEACTGFAHLHPAPAGIELAPHTEAGHQLAFSINLPDPGVYRLWAQVRVDGRDLFAPFDLRAVP